MVVGSGAAAARARLARRPLLSSRLRVGRLVGLGIGGRLVGLGRRRPRPPRRRPRLGLGLVGRGGFVGSRLGSAAASASAAARLGWRSASPRPRPRSASRLGDASARLGLGLGDGLVGSAAQRRPRRSPRRPPRLGAVVGDRVGGGLGSARRRLGGRRLLGDRLRGGLGLRLGFVGGDRLGDGLHGSAAASTSAAGFRGRPPSSATARPCFGRRRRGGGLRASSDAASWSRTCANAAASVLSIPPSGSWTASAIE